MPITFACPCGRVLRAADEHAGRQSKCPVCSRELTVPEADVPAPRLAASEPDAYGFRRDAPPATDPRVPDFETPAASPAGEAKLRDRPRLSEDDEDMETRRTRGPDGRRSARPVAVSRGVVTGVLMIAGGVLLFVLTSSARHPRIVYPAFLVIGGLVTLVKALTGNED